MTDKSFMDEKAEAYAQQHDRSIQTILTAFQEADNKITDEVLEVIRKEKQTMKDQNPLEATNSSLSYIGETDRMGEGARRGADFGRVFQYVTTRSAFWESDANTIAQTTLNHLTKDR